MCCLLVLFQSHCLLFLFLSFPLLLSFLGETFLLISLPPGLSDEKREKKREKKKEKNEKNGGVERETEYGQSDGGKREKGNERYKKESGDVGEGR